MPPRKPKPAPKRRSGPAKALRSPHLRQRVKPGKHRPYVADDFSPAILLRRLDKFWGEE